VIWDITMSSPASTSRRIGELRDNGYRHIEGIFVDIPVETSIARTESRHRHGHDRFLNGDGPGGRFIPADIIRSQADSEYGSINRRSFETVKSQFDRWTLYDNSVSGRDAVIIAQGSADHHGIEEWRQGDEQ
jgi:predicted ABC-type ATPase